jgi:hypothetical protein
MLPQMMPPIVKIFSNPANSVLAVPLAALTYEKHRAHLEMV